VLVPQTNWRMGLGLYEGGGEGRMKEWRRNKTRSRRRRMKRGRKSIVYEERRVGGKVKVDLYEGRGKIIHIIFRTFTER